MHLLTAENISKSYTERVLLENVNFSIEEGQKIGIIGLNGAGKTTLLKMIVGNEQPDTGRFIIKNSIKIEYLPQEPDFEPENSVLMQVFRGESADLKRVLKYELALLDPTTSPEVMMRLTEEMDAHQAWALESEAKNVLTKLGIPDFTAKISTLSGGQRKRVALAAALIRPCDLLVLDEPTNHLDNMTIEWLEGHLKSRKGALLMITHDRYFLDRVTNAIFELDQGRIFTYAGNYNTFLERKAEREVLESSTRSKTFNLYKRELAWIKRGAKARSTKQKARKERFEDLKDQLIYDEKEELEISVGGKRLGRKIIELNNISKSYGDIVCFKDFTFVPKRNDRIGILGTNGMGKSTLIHIIAGKITPDSGTVDVGETVKIGFFSQENMHMDVKQRAIDFIKEGGEFVETANGDKVMASQMMERFLFDADLQWSPIGKLSGGEKRRLHLLRVLMEGPNVLLLDEPTNDLDIQTLTVLESYIEHFQGVVMVVSHDRYLLDKVADRLLVFEGNGFIKEYTGNYAQFLDLNVRENFEPEAKKTKPVAEQKRPERNQKIKFTFKEQREWETIDEDIALIEKQIDDIGKKMNTATTDYEHLQILMIEKQQLEEALEEKTERWIYLNELAEKMS